MKRYLGALAALCLATLTACGSGGFLDKLKTDVQAATSITPTATSVVVSSNTVNALEQSATNYLGAPLCKAGQTFLSNGCRVSAATQPIKSSVLSLRTARTNYENFYLGHYTGPLGASGLVDALNAAVTTLQSTLKNYGVQS